MLIIVVSRLLIVLFSILIAWIGLKWHIGFTVQNRYSWGLLGSFIPLSQRILLNFIWNAVQCKCCYTRGWVMTDADRLEWRPTHCSVLDSYMALFRAYAKHFRPKHADHD